MGPLGVPELIFILVLALLIFGPRKLPEIGRTLGKAMGEFRRATSDLKRSLDTEIAIEEDRQRSARPAPAAAPPPDPAPPAAPGSGGETAGAEAESVDSPPAGEEAAPAATEARPEEAAPAATKARPEAAVPGAEPGD